MLFNNKSILNNNVLTHQQKPVVHDLKTKVFLLSYLSSAPSPPQNYPTTIPRMKNPQSRFKNSILPPHPPTAPINRSRLVSIHLPRRHRAAVAEGAPAPASRLAGHCITRTEARGGIGSASSIARADRACPQPAGPGDQIGPRYGGAPDRNEPVKIETHRRGRGPGIRSGHPAGAGSPAPA